jgi:MYXO-CTERM domain-containing protein
VCDVGQVCERGVCLATCDCRPCTDGKVCGDSGECVDPGCESLTCGAGFVCVAGTCTDACTSAACPGGAACEVGSCAIPQSITGPNVGGTGGGSGGMIVINPGSTSGSSSGGTGSDMTPEADPEAVGKRSTQQAGCACRLGAGQSEHAGKLAALLGLGLLFGARRRRASRRLG